MAQISALNTIPTPIFTEIVPTPWMRGAHLRPFLGVSLPYLSRKRGILSVLYKYASVANQVSLAAKGRCRSEASFKGTPRPRRFDEPN